MNHEHRTSRHSPLMTMLSYCTNIHPAESWDHTMQALAIHVPLIQQELKESCYRLRDEPLGIGLRLSARAAEELLSASGGIASFISWLSDHNARVETINGFPYGNFHGQAVKERVFLPDWTTPERFDYTCNLFRILAAIGQTSTGKLSVSTLPGSHSCFHADEDRMFARLDAISGFLDVLSRKSDHIMQLGLEPEPFGHFHDTAGAIRFFDALRNRSRRPELIERHLGITYDTCHFAILNESPSKTLSAWEENNISLCKVQCSNALECHLQGVENLHLLQPFDEGVYFHQTSIRTAERTMLFPDLPHALAYARDFPEEIRNSVWRIHYHIPVYAEPDFPMRGTGDFIIQTLDYLRDHPSLRPHMEVETYTWSVLPDHMKMPLSAQIARELNYISSLQTTP